MLKLTDYRKKSRRPAALAGLIAGIAVIALATGPMMTLPQAHAQEPESRPQQTPPPRTISDITAILDQQQPDRGRAEDFRETANAVVEGKMSG